MNSLAGKRVLVTGAGGFIGRHLVEALVTEGAEVRAFVHYNSRGDWGNLDSLASDVLESVDVVAGEIQDPFSVARAVENRELVFHLAALVGIPYSYVAPKSYVDTNALGTVNVLESARRWGVERVIHTSTSETYGTARYTPIDERHPLCGQSPYSASKIAADKLAESYFLSFAVPVTTLRPFNTFGPRQSLRAVIPTILAQALAGDQIKLGSLDPARDFTFVTDTARAFLAVASAATTVGETLNAGSGRSVTIGQLCELCLTVTGSQAQIVADPERVRPPASEVFELVCDAGRLRELTGWEPRVALTDGLERTAQWMRGVPASSKTRRYAI